MKKITFAEFHENLEKYEDFAHVEPVQIGENADEPEIVLLPYQVYQQLRQGNREALDVSELPEEAIDAVLSAKLPLDK